MGKNKLQKFKDMSQWPHVFEFAQSNNFIQDNSLKGNWGKSFFKNNNPIILELGCGKGEYTVSLAELYPENNFIGIDIKGARMWTGAKESFEKDLKNVAFLRTHIEFITRFFAPGEVSEIWLTFPDPQMKRANKRLTSAHFMTNYQEFVKPGGKIHLKTDSQFMFKYTVEMTKANRLPVLFETDDLYHSGLVDKILSIETFYESQWLQRGLTIKYVKFEIPAGGTFVEPIIKIEPDSYRSFGRSARNMPANKQTS